MTPHIFLKMCLQSSTARELSFVMGAMAKQHCCGSRSLWWQFYILGCHFIMVDIELTSGDIVYLFIFVLLKDLFCEQITRCAIYPVLIQVEIGICGSLLF